MKQKPELVIPAEAGIQFYRLMLFAKEQDQNGFPLSRE